MNRNRWIAAVVTGAVAAGAIGTAVASEGGQDQKASFPVDVNAPAPAERAPASVEAAFSVLDREAVTIPSDLSYPSLQRAGGNLSAARIAARPDAGNVIYVLPSADGICLASTTGVEAGCFTSSDVTEAVTANSAICAPGLDPDVVAVYGTVPDGTRSVSIALADKSSVKVATSGNVYSYKAPKSAPRPIAVSWTSADGSTADVPANVPEDFRTGRCATPPTGPVADDPNRPTGGPFTQDSQ